MAPVRVIEFTDPYCTWCWGAEPVRRRLAEVYGDQVAVEYVMGGLAEDFEAFGDPAADAAGAGGVGAHWLTASKRHGMPVDTSPWRDDPPASTYPANVAYEAATFQDEALAAAYLRRLREAGAAEGRNLAREAVLVELAGEVGLDADRFAADLGSDRAEAAFRRDLRTAREHGATSFPTFLVEAGGRSELLRGYRPFSAFEKVFAAAEVDLRRREPRPIPDLVEAYGRMAAREVAEIHELTREEAAERLWALAEEGRVRAVEAGTGHLWEPADG